MAQFEVAPLDPVSGEPLERPSSESGRVRVKQEAWLALVRSWSQPEFPGTGDIRVGRRVVRSYGYSHQLGTVESMRPLGGGLYACRVRWDHNPHNNERRRDISTKVRSDRVLPATPENIALAAALARLKNPHWHKPVFIHWREYADLFDGQRD